jgi:thiol-disulfide isomerase/thioredoxin
MLLELSLRPVISLLLVSALAIAGCDKQSPQTEQANAVAAANVSMPVPEAEQGVLDESHKGEAIPAVQVIDPSGTKVALASLTGKPLLLNLWATWCAPCIKEMPTLDALAERESGRIRVLAVSQDLEGAKKVAPFFAERKFKALEPWLDPDVALSTGFGANLPTTILYDSRGKEVWRYSGALDWTGERAKALLARAG